MLWTCMLTHAQLEVHAHLVTFKFARPFMHVDNNMPNYASLESHASVYFSKYAQFYMNDFCFIATRFK